MEADKKKPAGTSPSEMAPAQLPQSQSQPQPPLATDFLQLLPAAAAPSQLALPAVGRGQYTHAAMVDLMATQPDYSHAMLAAHFGRPASWLASVLASEQFQLELDRRRGEIADPSLTLTLHERFKALAIRTSNVMMQKMDSEEVTDFLVLKAGEIAVKALGMGQKGQEMPQTSAPATPATDTLAERLMAAMDARERGRTVDIPDAEEVMPEGNV